MNESNFDLLQRIRDLELTIQEKIRPQGLDYSPSNNKHMSDDVRQVTQAILSARASYVTTGKDGDGKVGSASYKYAKIDGIYNAVVPALTAHNILITHAIRLHDNGIDEVMVTRLTHTLTGQFIEDERFNIGDKKDNQGRGGANTYTRKYAVLCLCAIPTEDDDGQTAVISGRQLVKLNAVLDGNVPLTVRILKGAKISELADLPEVKFEAVLAFIEKEMVPAESK